jgi:hypothetical protein
MPNDEASGPDCAERCAFIAGHRSSRYAVKRPAGTDGKPITESSLMSAASWTHDVLTFDTTHRRWALLAPGSYSNYLVVRAMADHLTDPRAVPAARQWAKQLLESEAGPVTGG